MVRALREAGNPEVRFSALPDRDHGLLDLYVSRGIGTSVLPFRLGSPPEVAVFDWHLAG